MPKKVRETERHKAAFEVWFSVEKNFERTREILRRNQPPVNVHLSTLYRWAEKYKWDERAGEREAAVQRKLMNDSVDDMVDFLKRKRTYGKLLQRRALEYWQKEFPPDVDGKPSRLHIDNPHTAATVLGLGTQMEQEAMGIPDWIIELLTDDDEERLRRAYNTALEELSDLARTDGAEGDEGTEAFPSVRIKPLPPDGDSSK